MTYAETRQEQDRILGVIHDFCRGETMVGKGCACCPIAELDVCNDQGTKAKFNIKELRETEKIINEVMTNAQSLR